jgi:hypothetical protein
MQLNSIDCSLSMFCRDHIIASLFDALSSVIHLTYINIGITTPKQTKKTLPYLQH